jgi:DNA polymerase III delta subunit
LVALLGPDRVRKLERIEQQARELSTHALDRHRISATELPAAALVGLCRQQPAASAVRLIVVDEAHRMPMPGIELLRQHAPAIARASRVLFLIDVELTSRHAWARTLQDAGSKKWLQVERFPGRATSPAKPFALVEALGRGDLSGALTAVRTQLQTAREAPEIVGLIAWQLQRWVTVKRLLMAGHTAQRIEGLTGLHGWQVERLQGEVAQRSLAWLQDALAKCWKLDTDVKRGRVVPELAVEQFVSEVCLAGSRA